ncbi:MATE family efflux transporter [Enterocloster sp.]|uniref:MATE family efflux transporter n=1 Tax=Enterocloster sp. TaxID=2719315 RepID=UPI003AF054D5
MGRFKPFAACVFPAVFAFALSGIYAIVDGFFVGRSIGDTGLSAINIAYPVTALIQAAGTGTGMGGAVMYSVRLAEKRDSEAENFMKGVFFYLALTGILLTVILFPLTDPLLSLMGADGELMKPGREYLSVIVLGSVFQVFGTGVVPLIRNQGKSIQAMYCMIGGFVTNIFLDYLFVWVLRLGMAGAAWASVAGQAVTMAGGLLCMRGQKIPVGIPRQALSVFFSIWRIGLAPFGITMCPMISLLLMNRASLQYGGSEGVACYACIAYVITIMYLILQGVGDGSQPLMSRFYGEDNKKEVRITRTMAYAAAAVMGVALAVLLYWCRNGIGVLFGASETVSLAVGTDLYIFLAAVPFLAFLRVTTAGFYATEQTRFSYMIVYGEPIFLALLLPALPAWMGLKGVWWSQTGAQILTALMGWGLKLWSDRVHGYTADAV